MTYLCILSGILTNSASVLVDFDGTYNEGGGPKLTIVDEDEVLEAPLDPVTGKAQDIPLELKYSNARISISGQFKEGLGSMDWVTPGSTNAEKLVSLQKLGVLPLTFTWPDMTKIWNCKFDRLELSEQGGYGTTIVYDISLLITGSA